MTTTKTTKWTKKDVRTLQSAARGFWLDNRMWHDDETIRRAYAEAPVERISAHISALLSIVKDRVEGFTGYRASIENARQHPAVWGAATGEMIARWEADMASSLKDIAKGEALIARIRVDGLPSEMDGFDPTARA